MKIPMNKDATESASTNHQDSSCANKGDKYDTPMDFTSNIFGLQVVAIVDGFSVVVKKASGDCGVPAHSFKFVSTMQEAQRKSANERESGTRKGAGEIYHNNR